MKKIAAIIIGISLLTINTVVSYSEESKNNLGLEKCINAIRLDSNENNGVRTKIQESFAVYLENKIKTIMDQPDIAKEKMGIEIGDDEYEIQQIRDMFVQDIDNGILISTLKTTKYLSKYAKTGCFSYLLNNKLFDVAGKNFGYGGAMFSIEGEHLTGNELIKVFDSWNLVTFNNEAYDYIKNHNNLEKELIAKGETEVENVAIFGIGYLTVLYIQGENDEYMVKLYDSDGKSIPEIKPFVLYTAVEVINAFNNPDVINSPYTQGIAKEIITEKPTYETEAKALQAEGLLLGNEKGLDLLKPLTRIEAATMLLRAMGESTDYTTQTQTFSDVPVSHWGYGAAENAYSLGLVMGVGDGLFAPDDSVTAEQFATMVLRAGNHADFNWEDAINIMIDEEIITPENAETMDLFTRGDMAKIIYEARERNLF